MDDSAERFPVTVLTGFLGSGKTTLLNRLLRGDHGLRLGVLVNDFGAINIDARLVDTLEGDSISLSNGCVCCDQRGDLVASTLRVLNRPNPPEHLVVEASGIADPAAIASVFRTTSLRERVRLDGIICLVDAENARNPRADQQLVEDQLRSADIVVLNKIDLVDEACKPELVSWIRSIASEARILDAVHADVPLQVVLDTHDVHTVLLRGQEPQRGRHPAFGSWSYHVDRPMAYRKVKAALESLPTDVYRAKGVVYLADAPNLKFVAQMVGQRVTIGVAGPWGEDEPETHMVCIGARNALSGEDMVRRFDGCITRSVVLMSEQNLRRMRIRA